MAASASYRHTKYGWALRAQSRAIAQSIAIRNNAIKLILTDPLQHFIHQQPFVYVDEYQYTQGQNKESMVAYPSLGVQPHYTGHLCMAFLS